MNIDAFDIVHSSQAQQRFKMTLVRMYSTIAKQTANMKLRLILFHVLNGF